MLRILTLMLAFGSACSPSEEPPIQPPVETPKTYSVLALGDSYTKGESVPWAQNFPNQLADSLRGAGFSIAGVRNIAQTGWRTDQLQQAIAAATDIADSTFDLVTLCIGVNNQYQNADFNTYRIQFESLLKTAVDRAGGIKQRVVVLSIPDWAYTPYGQSFASDPAKISQQIDQYNYANRSITESYGITYLNVTEISRQGLAQPALVAPDGLHPSALQYTEWVKKLLPPAKTALAE